MKAWSRQPGKTLRVVVGWGASPGYRKADLMSRRIVQGLDLPNFQQEIPDMDDSGAANRGGPVAGLWLRHGARRTSA